MREKLLLASLALASCDAAATKPSVASAVSTATISASSTPALSAPSEQPLIAASIPFELRQVGGVTATTAAPLVLAIHGLGDTPAHFAPLLAGFSEPARLVFPRGRFAHGRGFSWFTPGGSRADGIRDAAAALAAMLDELTQRYPTRGKPIITGFSQGGMLAFAMATLHGDKIDRAIPLAGALPLELVPLHAPAGAPSIFALHGDADGVLPIGPTRDLTQTLRERGFAAELSEYPGVVHTVSPAMHRALERRLREAMAN